MTADSTLRAILRAGGLAETDDAVTALALGLSRLGELYPIMRLTLEEPRAGRQKAELLRLRAAAKAIGEILDDDFTAGSGRETILDAFGAPATREILTWLRRLPAAVDGAVIAIDRTEDPRPRRREDPETWLFVALYDLFAFINENPPVVGKYLECFVAGSVDYLELGIQTPFGAAFEARTRAALKRREEAGGAKVDLMPLPLLPSR